MAGSIVAFTIGALAIRAAGTPEAVAGGTLAVLVAGVFALFVVGRLHGAGLDPARAVGWGLALLCASAAPTLVSVFPGRIVADAVVRSLGDAVPLPAAARGRVRVLVSATLPEKAFVSFSLRGTRTDLDGTLGRGVRWTGTGEEKRHYHEEKSSALLDADVPPDANALVLATAGGDPVALRVRVFVPPLPSWVAPLVSVVVIVAFGLRHHGKRRERATVMAACVGGCSGLFAGAIATPDGALGAVIGGVVLGALVGVPLSAVVRAAGRLLARSVSSLAHSALRRDGAGPRTRLR